MALAALQSALARLYTDAAERAALRADSAAFGARFGLSKEDSATLARDVLGAAEDFAGTLYGKRFHEAARSLPLAGEVLGPRFAPAFADYAVATAGLARSPAQDALAFHDWLTANQAAELSSVDRDALRYEQGWLLMQHTARRCLLRWLLVPGCEGGSRKLVAWWRWRGRLRHWPRSP